MENGIASGHDRPAFEYFGHLSPPTASGADMPRWAWQRACHKQVRLVSTARARIRAKQRRRGPVDRPIGRGCAEYDKISTLPSPGARRSESAIPLCFQGLYPSEEPWARPIRAPARRTHVLQVFHPPRMSRGRSGTTRSK
jgi:hypothetical protein